MSDAQDGVLTGHGFSPDVRAHLVDGEPIVVRSKRRKDCTVVSGIVELYDGGELPGDETILAEITGGHMWTWGDDEPDEIRRFEAGKDDGPPRSPEGGYCDEYDYQPQLRERDGNINLTIPSPVWDGKGLMYYVPQPAGDVIEFVSEPIVVPETLLPNRGEQA